MQVLCNTFYLNKFKKIQFGKTPNAYVYMYISGYDILKIVGKKSTLDRCQGIRANTLPSTAHLESLERGVVAHHAGAAERDTGNTFTMETLLGSYVTT